MYIHVYVYIYIILLGRRWHICTQKKSLPNILWELKTATENHKFSDGVAIYRSYVPGIAHASRARKSEIPCTAEGREGAS